MLRRFMETLWIFRRNSLKPDGGQKIHLTFLSLDGVAISRLG